VAAAPVVAVAGPGARTRALVIFNPASGRGNRAAARLRRVVDERECLGCAVTVRTTEAAGDAEGMARAAEPEFEVVVAAGGDGTVNEVANGLAASRPLAVIPLGTANVLANEIGLPHRPRRLAAVIATGPACPVWPGRAGGRHFLMMAGIGFDAQVLRRVDARHKRRLGKLAFVWPLLVSLWRHRPREYVVHIGGADYRAASVVVAKGHFYAGRYVIAPPARLADPIFQIVLFRGGSRWAALRYLAAMALGIVHRLPDVAILTAHALSVDGDEPGLVQLDGEIAAQLPLAVEVAASPLLLVQPPRARR
jgi:diacylglycerol kinase (ATP)